MREVYLDHSATSPIRPEAFQALQEAALRDFGNPSSLHRKGVDAERIISEAREVVAGALGGEPDEVVFTSGATESNNMAIKGVARALSRYGNHIITTRIEHPSVFETCKQLEEEGFQVTYLHVKQDGMIDLDELREAIIPGTILVSIMHVNNETGIVQPVVQVGTLLKQMREKITFHVDAVQSFCKLPVLPREWGIDLVSVSSHKIGGPKGVGALFIKKGTKIAPIILGGGQERGLRSETENVPGIAGFGAAVKAAMAGREREASELDALRRRLIEKASAIKGARLVGAVEGCAPHIVNLSFPGLRGELLLHYLEERGVYVSTGSACSSRSRALSRTLTAMGLTSDEAVGSIRISLGWNTTAEDIDYACEALAACVAKLAALVRR